MGEPVSALGAAAGENLASVSGGHSLPEAVLLGALTLFGLVSSEHSVAPPCLFLRKTKGLLISFPCYTQLRHDMPRQLTVFTRFSRALYYIP